MKETNSYIIQAEDTLTEEYQLQQQTGAGALSCP